MSNNKAPTIILVRATEDSKLLGAPFIDIGTEQQSRASAEDFETSKTVSPPALRIDQLVLKVYQQPKLPKLKTTT